MKKIRAFVYEWGVTTVLLAGILGYAIWRG